ncbi:MAG: twin-arginine translocase TatA/TatE family subunit [Acidobacteriota bacterium]
MFGSLGVPELVIIFAIFLLIFGPKKLPQLGQALGRTIKGFRQGVRDGERDEDSLTESSRLPKSSD